MESAQDCGATALYQPISGSNQSNGSNSTNNPTPADSRVKTTEDFSEKTNQSSENSLNSTCKSLEERKIQNIERQQNNLRVMKRISVICSILMLSIIANIISATLVASPLFTIGIAVSLLLIILSIVRSIQLYLTNRLIDIQTIAINALLAGLKNNPLANDISLNNNTDLSSLLNNAITSLDTKNLTDLTWIMSQYTLFKNSKKMLQLIEISEESIRLKLKGFIKKIFSNDELTDHLRELKLDVKTLQKSAKKYICSTPMNDLYDTITLNT